MFSRKQRQRERNYNKGFRDALVSGRPSPGMYENGDLVREQPGYMRGFEDGERAETRIIARVNRKLGQQATATLQRIGGDRE